MAESFRERRKRELSGESQSDLGTSFREKRRRELSGEDYDEYKNAIDTTNLTLQPPPRAPEATPAQNKLGIVQAQTNPFKTQPKVNPALKPSNPNVVAVTPVSHNPINALYQQLRGNPNGPTVELPSTGSKKLDKAAHFIGESTGQILQNPVGGTEQLLAKTIGNTTAKVLPKLAPYVAEEGMQLARPAAKTVLQKVTPALAKAGVSAVTGAIENTAAGAGIGQTDSRQVAENAGIGAAFGGGGTLIGAGLRATGRKVADVAEDLVRSSLRGQQAITGVGESGLRADAGKRILNDIDEQLQSTFTGNAPNKHEHYRSLLNDRNDTIAYIKQHEPEFEARKPRLRASNEMQESQPAPFFHNATPPRAIDNKLSDEVIPKSNTSGPQFIEPKVSADVQKSAPVREKPEQKKLEPVQRGFTETLLESEKPPEGFKEKLKSAYKPVSNQKTLDIANKRINKDAEEATSFVLGSSRFSAEKATVAQRLIDHYNTQGNFQRAVDVAQKVSEEATKAGQSIQALSMFNRLTPEGILIHAQRIAKKTNEALPLGAREVKVTPEVAADIAALAETTTKMTGVKDLSNDVMDILSRAKSGEALSETDKQTLKRFVTESKQFVQEVSRKPKTPRPPRTSTDKRVSEKVVSFLDAQEKAAKERLRARGISVSSTPLDIWMDYAIIGASKMGKGTVKFADWSAQMVSDLGEDIKPHLQNLYERSRETFEKTNSKISKSVLEKVNKSLAGGSEEKAQLKNMMEQLGGRVRSVIDQAKAGSVTDDALQDIRDLSDELADMLPDNQVTISPEKKYLQAVKSLSKKLAGVENEKLPVEGSVKEVQKLLSTITKLSNEGVERVKSNPTAEESAIESLGYQLMERTKPRTLSDEEKLTQRIIRKIGSSLSPEQHESIMTLAQKVSTVAGEEKRLASQDLQAVLQTLERPSILKKVSSLQTIGQLANPKTQVRNALGNELFYRVERLNKLLSTPIDIARSKLTGGERTVTFKTNNQGEYWKNWMRGLKAGWKGVNVNGLETQYDLGSPAFKSKYNPLTYMEKALGSALKSFDTAAYMRAYNNTIGELATLRAINEGNAGKRELISKYIREADDNMMNIAGEYGKYATFQDNNVVSRGLVALKRGLNLKQDFGVGDLVLKYPKTPGALLMRALEYSPAGFLRSASILARPFFKKEANTAEVTQALSRAIIGTTGLSGLGYFLLDKGVLTGSASKDRDIRDLQKSAGQGQYQVNLSALSRLVKSGFDPSGAKLNEGDFLYTYDWMQPISIAISMGANVRKNITEGKGKLSGLVGTAYNSLEGGLGTLTEQSVLSGLKRAAEGYPGQTVTDKIMDVLSDVPSSFVPTAFNQFNQLMDNNKRETYSPNKLEQSLNKASAKVPGLAQKLPQQYDTLGEPKKAFQNNSWANVLLNPGFSSNYKLSPEAKFIVDLIDESGDQTLAPRAPSKSITVDGESIKLNGDMYSQYQQLLGEETKKRISKIDPNASLKARASRTEKALNTAGEKARGQLKKELKSK